MGVTALRASRAHSDRVPGDDDSYEFITRLFEESAKN
jgi:hypothetical protein